MDRRTFIARGGTLGAASAAAATFGTFGPWAAVARAQAPTRGVVVDPTGTTLERTLLPTGDGYRRFTDGPGRPIVVCDELAAPKPGREDRRRALATVVHLTDIHLTDSQSPARVEFTDRLEDSSDVEPGFFSSAWRPQETLGAHLADAMLQALRAVGAGPVTGRAYDCGVTTGDATDNMQFNELDWFLDLMAGGRPFQFNSGDPDRYEGVQDDDELSFDASYYHPGSSRPDHYKDVLGFPDRPEMLDAAITPFTPVGLPMPWYSIYGNHDGLLQGNAFDNPAFAAIATGPIKVVGTPSSLSPSQIQRALIEGDAAALLTAPGAPVRQVTPDPARAATTPRDWVLRHREDRGGAGPIGHGLSADAVETGELHYTFEVAPGVLGVALDTVNRTAWASGSIDRAQFAWLEEQLVAASSRYLDPAGNEVTTSNDDQVIVVFAHHGIDSLDNPFPDLSRPEPEERVQGPEFEALLHRFPNVIACVVGHTHRNRIVPRVSPTADTGGFWDITTAAHIDHPQQARILEIVDNADGTLSIFATIVDHAGPASPPAEVRSVLDLASLARELGVNDDQKRGADEGEPVDNNVELLVTAPFRLAVAPPPAQGPGQGQGGPPAAPPGQGRRPVQPAGQPLPVTGLGTAAAGAALLAGAAALRGHGPGEAPDGPTERV
ncbi:MAG: TIGR03767 family metallophosphoesterase [Nitriliruptor sp.]|uniref:TIGR03767 family metallophosphoesterase n=1 Tax=Nitriliruptor sp. TaxID=2448056 RepID=UPI00349FDFEC